MYVYTFTRTKCYFSLRVDNISAELSILENEETTTTSSFYLNISKTSAGQQLITPIRITFNELERSSEC